VFFDLETTGLSGGAGTVAFLAGCGTFDAGAFRTRQFFLQGFAAERALLHAVAEVLGDAAFLVTYNGRTFDMPVMEMRWLFHRMMPLDAVPHVDMLPPARRLWREAVDGPDRSCRLVALEEALLGFIRVDDVPGWEIPYRYFEYVRKGDPAPLEPVLRHNRLDLVSLALLTARAQRLVREGHTAGRDARECVALGRLYTRAGRVAQARASFEAAADHAIGDRSSREDGLRELALLCRRQRQYADAARAWNRLLSLGHGRSPRGREAVAALAVHHEHRDRDLESARRYALRALQSEADPTKREAVRHRLARIERKLGQRPNETAEPPLLTGD
jgi:tetratricopeptide (TPR) repeat protein